MGILDRRRALMASAKTIQDIILDSPPYWDLKNGSNLLVDGDVSQGACVVNSGSNIYIYFFVTNNNATTQYLYRFNLNVEGFEKVATYTTLSHANSASYNPTENVIYVGTMDSSIGFAEIDLTDFSIKKTQVAYNSGGTAHIPTSIAYDRTNNVIYSAVGWTKMNVYDTSYNLLEEITLTNPNLNHNTGQGLETDGQYLYRCFSSPSNQVDVYTLDGVFVKTVTLGFRKEFEELCYDWNGCFYASVSKSGGQEQLYAVLLRSFGGYLRLSYVPPYAWSANQTNGSIVRWGNFSFTFTSTGSAGWGLKVQSAGSPYGYSYLHGKKCRITYSIKRASGSTGRIIHMLFTSDTNSNGASSTNFATATKGNYIPTDTTDYVDFSHTFIIGQDFLIPEAGKEGTYINWSIFMNADSGNKCLVKNFKFEVEV